MSLNATITWADPHHGAMAITRNLIARPMIGDTIEVDFDIDEPNQDPEVEQTFTTFFQTLRVTGVADTQITRPFDVKVTAVIAPPLNGGATAEFGLIDALASPLP